MIGYITRKTVAELKPQKKGYFFWDKNLSGFGIRVSPKGRKTFVIQTRVRKRIKRKSLGTYPKVSVLAARSLAVNEFTQVSLRNNGVKSVEKPTKVSLREFTDKHWSAISRSWRPATEKTNRSYYRRMIEPVFGNTFLSELYREDILVWFSSLQSKPGAANRALPVLQSITKHAISVGAISQNINPASDIKRYKSKSIDRILSTQELRSFGAALNYFVERYPSEVYIVLLLALCGARISEVLNMEWSNVHEDRVFLPYTKTGPRMMCLSSDAQNIIANQRSLNLPGPWVFPKIGDETRPRSDIQYFWGKLRNYANIKDVRLHDLRHNFASWAAMEGIDLVVIGHMLGHGDIASTNRYIHYSPHNLSAEALKAQSAIGKIILGKSNENE